MVIIIIIIIIYYDCILAKWKGSICLPAWVIALFNVLFEMFHSLLITA
jgi:hypothetical protein